MLRIILFFLSFFMSFSKYEISYGKTPDVILISLDGFRHDYPQKFGLEFLSELQRASYFSHKLYPIFPSKTYPNHFSLITGAYPDEHGIIGNIFYDKETGREFHIGNDKIKNDPSWYKKAPLWVSLEKRGIKTASYFWPGSEVPISGIKPTYYKKFDNNIPSTQRLEGALTWMKLPEKERPHFISLYISEVDSYGHQFGPEATETKESCLKIDKLLKKFFADARKINPLVNIIICSDHGMTTIEPKNILYLSDLMDTKKIAYVTGEGPILHLYFKTEEEAQKFYPSIQKTEKITAYLKKDIPKRHHLKKSKYTGDIFIEAKYPYYILQNKNKSLSDKGAHGYDPNLVSDMIGIYYEEGPGFNKKSPRRVHLTNDVYWRIKKLFKGQYQKKTTKRKKNPKRHFPV